MDLAALELLKGRPGLFARGADLFWDDPHISQSMLEAHLDPHSDAASRRPETIDRTVDWIVSHLGMAPGTRVLDLGCGPGLYAQRLARMGMEVTGMDYSRGSLAYARRQAAAAGLDVKYVLQDYRDLDETAEYDVALMIYYDLGALSDGDRDLVLSRIHRALRPGGKFVFDVLTQTGRRMARAEPGWRAHRGGFWRPGSHLVLTDVFEYPGDQVELDQYTVIDADGRFTVYRLWTRYYRLDDVHAVLERAGFRLESAWADLTGLRLPAAETAGLGIVARKA